MLNSSTLQKFSNFCPGCNVFVGSSRYLAALSGTGPTRLPCQPVTRLRKTRVVMMKEMVMMMMKEMQIVDGDEGRFSLSSSEEEVEGVKIFLP